MLMTPVSSTSFHWYLWAHTVNCRYKPSAPPFSAPPSLSFPARLPVHHITTVLSTHPHRRSTAEGNNLPTPSTDFANLFLSPVVERPPDTLSFHHSHSAPSRSTLAMNDDDPVNSLSLEHGTTNDWLGGGALYPATSIFAMDSLHFPHSSTCHARSSSGDLGVCTVIATSQRRRSC